MANYKVFEAAPEGTQDSHFVHLHVHSDYSLLDGASKIDTLVAKAKKLGMKALALTDHGNMFGVLNFEKLCHINGLNPLCGEEFYIAEGSHKEKTPTRYTKDKEHKKYNYHLILIAKNVEGYKNLCWLSSLAFTEGFYSKPRIDFELLQKYHAGLICLSACIAGELPQALYNGDKEGAKALALKYQALFGKENYYIELQDHAIDEERITMPRLIDLAKELDIPMVVTNDIHYANQDDAQAQDAMLCIGTGSKIADTDRMRFANDSFYLKTEQEMRQLFPNLSEAYDNTIKIASMCDLTIPQYKTQELKDTLPVFKIPKEFVSQDAYVLHLVEKGLKEHYKTITSQIIERATYELGIIFQMGFSGYFLIVWNFINWAKQHNIPIGPGRGSGAGSLVAYCMRITDIDPFKYGLIFERFLNPERVSMPDFDVDMCFEGRQDIIQYTRDTYGDSQVGHIITFGTLKAKNALRDVGRVLDIPLSQVNMLTKCIPANPKAKLKDAFTPPDKEHSDNGQLIPYKDDPQYQKLFELAFKLEGCIRNAGLHASGLVIGKTVLPNWAPVYKDSKTGKVAVQYTMDIIEPCGLVKFDYLGLKTLTLIKYAQNLIRKRPGQENFSVANAPTDDSKTFDLFCRGDTDAVFQFESGGMKKILQQCKPRSIQELTALNALYRPGPMDYIPQYINGKWKPKTIHYPDPCLEDILKETYGVMVYQEQVMQVAQKIAGYSLGGADMLRRAMGKKKPEEMAKQQKIFIEGAVKKGFSAEHAKEIFDIMVPFAGYGFNKSHAAAYSVVAYQTAYLKAHYPAEFMAANLTNEITSADKLPQYIQAGRAMGLKIDPPDINRSDEVFNVVDNRIVFGLMGIKGLGEAAAKEIITQRHSGGLYKSFMDFLDRVDLRTVNKKALEVLINTGTFDKLGQNRRELSVNCERAVEYAQKKKDDYTEGQASLFGGTGEKEYNDFVFEKQEDLKKIEKLEIEKDLIGCYISGHPLDDYKDVIKKCVTVTFDNIKQIALEQRANGGVAKGYGKKTFSKEYIGLGILQGLKSITTKSGKSMAFAKLQDLTGSYDLTFFSKTWEEIKGKLKDDNVYAFRGNVDWQETREEPSFLVNSIEDIVKLKEKKNTQLHIKMQESCFDKLTLQKIKDFILSYQNTNPSDRSCFVFLHLYLGGKEWQIQATSKLKTSCTSLLKEGLKKVSGVQDVWACC